MESTYPKDLAKLIELLKLSEKIDWIQKRKWMQEWEQTIKLYKNISFKDELVDLMLKNFKYATETDFFVEKLRQIKIRLTNIALPLEITRIEEKGELIFATSREFTNIGMTVIEHVPLLAMQPDIMAFQKYQTDIEYGKYGKTQDFWRIIVFLQTFMKQNRKAFLQAKVTERFSVWETKHEYLQPKESNVGSRLTTDLEISSDFLFDRPQKT